MNSESFQDTLFEDPIGLRFRHAREKARWSLESVAQQLKLPVAVLEAIEREDWARLGAPIFIRSYVGSYAKILGLPAQLADDVVRGKPAPQLVAIGSNSPTQRLYKRSRMNIAYLVLTVLIVAGVVVLAMYFQAPKRTVEVLPLDPPMGLAAGAPAQSDDRAGAALDSDSQGSTSGLETMTLASMAPSPSSVPAATGDDIVLRFRRQSWVDIVDRSGVHIERGLVAAGTERRFAADQLAQITLGDAGAVEVDMSGIELDLTPYRDVNVARFAVSSDGKAVFVAGN